MPCPTVADLVTCLREVFVCAKLMKNPRVRHGGRVLHPGLDYVLEIKPKTRWEMQNHIAEFDVEAGMFVLQKTQNRGWPSN